MIADASVLPENIHQEWGPGRSLIQAGIQPVSHKNALVETLGGETQMLFNTNGPVELAVSLVTTIKTANTQEEIQVKEAVAHYFNKTNQIIVSISLPDPGRYALNMFSRPLGSEGPLPWICSYIVSSVERPQLTSPYPVPAIGLLQPEVFKSLKLTSHESPIIQCTEQGQLELTFNGTKNIIMRTLLALHPQNQMSRKVVGCIWGFQENDTIDYTMYFKEAGVYTLDLFAKLGEKFTRAYTCIINVVVPQASIVTFPEAYEEWKDSYELIEPKTSPLPSKSTLPFKVSQHGQFGNLPCMQCIINISIQFIRIFQT